MPRKTSQKRKSPKRKSSVYKSPSISQMRHMSPRAIRKVDRMRKSAQMKKSCVAWLKNSNVNPLTKRRIRSMANFDKWAKVCGYGKDMTAIKMFSPKAAQNRCPGGSKKSSAKKAYCNQGYGWIKGVGCCV